jgi:hypothetical protein
MPASFEDFIELAGSRLERAAAAVAGGTRITSATCAALASATRSLITLSTRYGQTPAGAPIVAWLPEFAELLVRWPDWCTGFGDSCVSCLL